MSLPAPAWLSRACNSPGFYLSIALALWLAGVALSLGGLAGLGLWPRVIIGLLLLLLPGACLFALLPARQDWDLIDLAGYGFAFSMALMTTLGLLTRSLAMSIDALELIWHLLSLLALAAVVLKRRALPARKLKLPAPTLVLLLILLIQVALYAHASVFATGSPRDQYRNQAAINGFLREQPLGWQEPYYESGNPIADRMILTYWVLAQALLVELSGAPILLARYLITPFVMLMSVAALYIFARNLGHGRRAALVFVCLGLLAFSLLADVDTQAGTRFFVRAQLDKVVAAFALAPIAISSAWLFARSRTGPAGLAFVASLLATCCVHAIIGAFAVAVIMLWCLIRFVCAAHDRRMTVIIALLALLLLTPLIILRLATTETTIYNFDSVNESETKRMIVYAAANPLNNGEKFYAISPLAAGQLTYLLLPLALLCLFARRKEERSQLILAYVIALALGLLPITAWIYGRLVSFNHVLRILWLFPYGYALGFVLETGWQLLCRRSAGLGRMAERLGVDKLHIALAGIAMALSLHFLAANPRVDFSRDIATATRASQDLLEIAAIIDARHDDRVWIAASEKLREPLLAAHWKVISLSRYSPERMSYYSRLPIADMIAQTNDNMRLYDSDVPLADKLAVIERYGIDYLLFAHRYARTVDALYQSDKQRFELLFAGETMRLARVHPAAGG